MTIQSAKLLTIAALSACLGLAQGSNQIPRTADGKPDLSGVWQSGGVSLYGEPGLAARPAAPPPVNPPPKREPLPYQPWAETKSKAFTASDDPDLRCLLAGIPRITSMPMPFEIIQTPKKM